MSETRYEHIQTKTTLNRVKEEAMPFEWSINPYRGCGHGCSFCYARAFQTFLGRSAEDEFQFHISVKENAAEALERQLTALARKFAYDIEAVSRHVGQVAIGTATDPYQPVEAKEQITRECLKVLAKYRIHTSVTTRSPLVMRDIDYLRNAWRFGEHQRQYAGRRADPQAGAGFASSRQTSRHREIFGGARYSCRHIRRTGPSVSDRFGGRFGQPAPVGQGAWRRVCHDLLA
ncbi:hypothetical protein HMSSN036_77090 [Paenibacillus macerans]|nr:hypothetical protein HMSSN036_77090 [Paenibacillus macerans]